MLRFTTKLSGFSQRFGSVRHYSEGFEISKYLSRIEAITKRAPVIHKARPQKQPASAKSGEPKSQPNRSGPKDGVRRNLQSHPGQGRNVQGRKPTTNKPKTNPDGTQARPQTQRQKPSSMNVSRRNNGAMAGDKRPVDRSAQASAQTQSQTPASASQADAGWVSLDATDSFSKHSSSSPLPRSSRRIAARKPGSKAKSSRKQQANKSSNSRNNNKSKSDIREYVPYLTPKEGLEIVLRNQGTSTGGFIEPLDVSLASLQPNLVDSAVTYNSRVRSLLNSVPPSVAEDCELLKKLVDNYVSGEYDHSILDSNKDSLSYQGLAREVFSNHSMDAQTREFFAKVGQGKLTPKQIVNRA